MNTIIGLITYSLIRVIIILILTLAPVTPVIAITLRTILLAKRVIL